MITTTPEDASDVDDDGLAGKRSAAERARGKSADPRPPGGGRRWTAGGGGPECAEGLEADVRRARAMEDQFREEMVRLQQQLGVAADGYVLPA